ncbi:MAG: SpoVR family protein [Calditrichaeota bacterium]|nr:MAG: SpoVR family protein [Calditrichota bacterium]MBL1205698.1 SpoVR family protein [Calditrichota bacterium]NOG45526.1 SpoVR family protein [Calditrichota bacterium]
MILSGELAEAKVEIEQYAADYGLDFFPLIFEILQSGEINELAAKGGFPIRYPHWRFGMEFEQLNKGYTYGLQKIYEMVINTDPCYAYLMDANNIIDQKLVMAHVYGHCDFFKNNYYFSKTNRKMMDEMANHATRIRRYIDQVGQENVEDFIDRCLSLENLIDYYAPFIKRSSDVIDGPKKIKKLKSKKYMDSFINPPEFIEQQKQLLKEEHDVMPAFPSQPETDVLQFLMEFAPLENWQRDVLSIISEESYYFAPQGMTKIMNEGWASYWHSTIMTTKVLGDGDVIDYADHHSGTVHMSPGQMNPYKVGIELFRDIEDRWNKGRFGKEYEECDSYEEKRKWDKKIGLGREKIFEVRKIYNDVTFIDTFLTQEFCQDNQLFTYRYNERTKEYEINSREFEAIKQQLLFSLTNMGQPKIQVVNGNYENRGELLLQHVTDNFGLDEAYAHRTLENLFFMWKRPVQIQTKSGETTIIMAFDGKEHKTQAIGE